MATITPGKPKAGAGKDDAATGNAKGGRKKMLIIMVAIVLAIVAGGAGTYFVFLAEPAEPAPPGPGDMVPMAPQTLSLAEGHYVKVGVSIELIEGQATAGGFDTSKAAELIIDTFSNHEMETLRDNEMRKTLSADLLKGVQKAYPDQVYDLYLTEFVLQ